MTESEAEAKKAYERAKATKEQLKKEILEGYQNRHDILRKLDTLWNNVNDFIPRHWRQE